VGSDHVLNRSDEPNATTSVAATSAAAANERERERTISLFRELGILIDASYDDTYAELDKRALGASILNNRLLQKMFDKGNVEFQPTISQFVKGYTLEGEPAFLVSGGPLAQDLQTSVYFLDHAGNVAEGHLCQPHDDRRGRTGCGDGGISEEDIDACSVTTTTGQELTVSQTGLKLPTPDDTSAATSLLREGGAQVDEGDQAEQVIDVDDGLDRPSLRFLQHYHDGSVLYKTTADNDFVANSNRMASHYSHRSISPSTRRLSTPLLFSYTENGYRSGRIRLYAPTETAGTFSVVFIDETESFPVFNVVIARSGPSFEDNGFQTRLLYLRLIITAYGNVLSKVSNPIRTTRAPGGSGTLADVSRDLYLSYSGKHVKLDRAAPVGSRVLASDLWSGLNHTVTGERIPSLRSCVLRKGNFIGGDSIINYDIFEIQILKRRERLAMRQHVLDEFGAEALIKVYDNECMSGPVQVGDELMFFKPDGEYPYIDPIDVVATALRIKAELRRGAAVHSCDLLVRDGRHVVPLGRPVDSNKLVLWIPPCPFSYRDDVQIPVVTVTEEVFAPLLRRPLMDLISGLITAIGDPQVVTCIRGSTCPVPIGASSSVEPNQVPFVKILGDRCADFSPYARALLNVYNKRLKSNDVFRRNPLAIRTADLWIVVAKRPSRPPFFIMSSRTRASKMIGPHSSVVAYAGIDRIEKCKIALRNVRTSSVIASGNGLTTSLAS
jgi:hypothetical protein